MERVKGIESPSPSGIKRFKVERTHRVVTNEEIFSISSGLNPLPASFTLSKSKEMEPSGELILVTVTLDMYGPITGSSSWMMTRTWDFTHQALLFAMWAVMMIGMMLASLVGKHTGSSWPARFWSIFSIDRSRTHWLTSGHHRNLTNRGYKN
jgi:hypothetical protein